MKVYDAANIRNVALVGHSASGKTQLTSAALFDAGAVNRFGKVDDGTTITDYDDAPLADIADQCIYVATGSASRCAVEFELSTSAHGSA